MFDWYRYFVVWWFNIVYVGIGNFLFFDDWMEVCYGFVGGDCIGCGVFGIGKKVGGVLNL